MLSHEDELLLTKRAGFIDALVTGQFVDEGEAERRARAFYPRSVTPHERPSYRDALLGELRLLELYEIGHGETSLPNALRWRAQSKAQHQASMLARAEAASTSFSFSGSLRRFWRRFHADSVRLFQRELGRNIYGVDEQVNG